MSRRRRMFQIAGVNVGEVKLRNEHGNELGRVLWDDESKRYLFDPQTNWYFDVDELRMVVAVIERMTKQDEPRS